MENAIHLLNAIIDPYSLVAVVLNLILSAFIPVLGIKLGKKAAKVEELRRVICTAYAVITESYSDKKISAAELKRIVESVKEIIETVEEIKVV